MKSNMTRDEWHAYYDTIGYAHAFHSPAPDSQFVLFRRHIQRQIRDTKAELADPRLARDENRKRFLRQEVTRLEELEHRYSLTLAMRRNQETYEEEVRDPTKFAVATNPDEVPAAETDIRNPRNPYFNHPAAKLN